MVISVKYFMGYDSMITPVECLDKVNLRYISSLMFIGVSWVFRQCSDISETVESLYVTASVTQSRIMRLYLKLLTLESIFYIYFDKFVFLWCESCSRSRGLLPVSLACWEAISLAHVASHSSPARVCYMPGVLLQSVFSPYSSRVLPFRRDSYCKT